MKYFAYGSNLCTKRLKAHVPSALFDTKGVLHGFTLKFHKRSQDGSAKCNALYTGNNTDEVRGVVFDIEEAEKPDLDEIEGLGRGYCQRTIRVHTDEGTVEIFAYVADENAIDDSLEPYTWYKDFVLSGAREHSLPETYIRRIESVHATQDENKAREKENRSLI